jgi:predicted Rossmann fold nucleotide-binding protein DprA/Smf involved in DNA uptake
VSSAAITDSQVIALLCAPLKIGDATPLSVAEWEQLASRIHGSAVARPGALPGMSRDDLVSELGFELELADRIVRLLERGGPFAFELERLSDRGVWLLTRADDDYPARLRRRLGLAAPPVLFGVGPAALLSEQAVAVVGSRDASEQALAMARELGARLANEGTVVVSGGARGVDRASMEGAMSGGGAAVAFLAEGLVRETQQRDLRELIAEGRLALITPFAPDARFAVWQAMARNKLIYCGADAAVVVAALEGTGGTWSGAHEALQHRWVPVWVWDGPAAPSGNAALIEAGASPLGAVLESERSVHDALVETPTTAAGNGGDGTAANAEDLFALVWPRLQAFLEEPRTEAELCEHFGLETAQVKAWTSRALAAELIENARPAGFVLASKAPEQASLFETA